MNVYLKQVCYRFVITIFSTYRHRSSSLDRVLIHRCILHVFQLHECSNVITLITVYVRVMSNHKFKLTVNHINMAEL